MCEWWTTMNMKPPKFRFALLPRFDQFNVFRVHISISTFPFQPVLKFILDNAHYKSSSVGYKHSKCTMQWCTNELWCINRLTRSSWVVGLLRLVVAILSCYLCFSLYVHYSSFNNKLVNKVESWLVRTFWSTNNGYPSCNLLFEPCRLTSCNAKTWSLN